MPSNRTMRSTPTAGEGIASFSAVLLTLATAFHGFGVYFCIGWSCPQPTEGQIFTYRALAAALTIAVVAALVLALRRGASWALLWHLTVAGAAGLTACLFAVPSIDVNELLQEEPPTPNRYHVPCHSGPPNDCPGG